MVKSLADFEPLRPAERILLASAADGSIAEVSAILPSEITEENKVGADFLRFLLLGGDEQTPVHEAGVHLRGACIDGILHLAFVKAERALTLSACRIQALFALNARLGEVSLRGSLLEHGFLGDGLHCGNLLLNDGFRSENSVTLIGAKISGNLDCGGKEPATSSTGGDRPGGTFAGEPALACDAAVITGCVRLCYGFQATGTVSLVGCKIEQDCDLDGGSFANPKPEANAIACDRAQIEGRLFFSEVSKFDGNFTLTGAHAGSLEDDDVSWRNVTGQVALHGFTYDRLGSRSPSSAKMRSAWIQKQGYFSPQPWEQIISILRAMGHPDEARAVAIEKQRQLRKAGKIPFGARMLHRLYGFLFGYGYRPARLFGAAAAVWLLCGLAYGWSVNAGPSGPGVPLLEPSPITKASPAPDYANFAPFIYSADVLLPVVDLGYKQEWRPVVSKNGRPLRAGQILRYLYWFEISFGWVAGLLLVGVLGNLIKRD